MLVRVGERIVSAPHGVWVSDFAFLLKLVELVFQAAAPISQVAVPRSSEERHRADDRPARED